MSLVKKEFSASSFPKPHVMVMVTAKLILCGSSSPFMALANICLQMSTVYGIFLFEMGRLDYNWRIVNMFRAYCSGDEHLRRQRWWIRKYLSLSYHSKVVSMKVHRMSSVASYKSFIHHNNVHDVPKIHLAFVSTVTQFLQFYGCTWRSGVLSLLITDQ